MKQKYTSYQKLGSGKYSTVFESYNRLNQQKVIMKILKHSNIHKINREIMTLNCVNFKSKNLAQLIDYGFDSSLKHHVLVRRNLNFFINYLNLIFIKLKIFEKFGHMSIRDYIIEDHFYSIKQIKKIIRQLLHAIDIVHQNGLIHRDIKMLCY